MTTTPDSPPSSIPSVNKRSEDKWADEDWELVLNKINAGECVPFLGAGASAGVFPTSGVLAEKLASKYAYPFPDRSDLTKVTQYIAVRSDRKNAKLAFLDVFAQCQTPRVKQPGNLHADLARLPLRLYVTTNYDDLMQEALKSPRLPRDPMRTVCHWNSFMVPQAPFEEPIIARPLVFHLHGVTDDANSLVLTEDDYLDFLTEMIRKPDLMPISVQQLIHNSTVLFIGYRLADWNFRILFRQLANYNVTSIAVFPPPSEKDPTKDKVQTYLAKYYAALNVKMISWTTGDVFTKELINRYSNKFGEGALIGPP